MAVINDSKTNDVYELRDKKLADAQVSTTSSDITVNSVVPVELEDGSCIKIKRDSLVQAFASVLNSNSQSTITTLFGADSNGNHANINMANLASVLFAILPKGVFRYISQNWSVVTTDINAYSSGFGRCVLVVSSDDGGDKTYYSVDAINCNISGKAPTKIHLWGDDLLKVGVSNNKITLSGFRTFAAIPSI